LAAAINRHPKTGPGGDTLLDPSNVTGARRVAEMPRFVQPELAILVEQAPQGDNWLHEVKFDGYRALARIELGTVEMRSRNDKDWTGPYRVLADELAKLPVENAMLDGEVVVQLPDGTTSFEELRRVLGSEGVEGKRRGAAGGRLAYYVFDLLYLDGFDLLDTPIEERRRLLAQLLARETAEVEYTSPSTSPETDPPCWRRPVGLGLREWSARRPPPDTGRAHGEPTGSSQSAATSKNS
jgi:ATP-dependent DNA ligase